ncbi:hypothetical protein B0H21DRAFT_386999 [Amylocystis lapponica]|nr:hypothetical protein B0H21DRAFT_386999 [Amylocystis lapponica]
MSALPPGLHLTFDSTLGAAFLGHFVTAILYGITSLQAFVYYRQYPNDPPLTRFLVLILWILDGLHVGLITGAMYYYLVKNFANPAVVEQPVWCIMVMIIVGNISNFIVRGVFGHRLWKLSKSLILPTIIGLLSLYTAGDAFYFASRGLKMTSYLDLHHIAWSLYLGFSVEVVTDWIITISQCILLRRLQTGIRRADSIIHFLMVYSINTGLLTSVCAMLCLITFATLPNMFVYFAFYFILSKLYVNSLLANLNARGRVMEAMDRVGGIHEEGSEPGKAVHLGSSTTESSEMRHTAGIQFTTIVDGPFSFGSTSVPPPTPRVHG